jgi:hypothetical protein
VTLEQDCIAILAKQMGPAAKIFLDRQCRHNLQKEPAKLEKSDLPALSKICFSATQSTLGVTVAENIKRDLTALMESKE